jgi:hypothetical protein
MSPIRDDEPLFPVFHALLFVLFDLLKKLFHMDHDTVSQNGCALLIDDAAGQQVKVILHLVHDHRVTSIISSLSQDFTEKWNAGDECYGASTRNSVT